MPFLAPELVARVTDEAGNFQLHRSMLPLSVPRLAFNGYNSSFFSQLTCEVGAHWLARYFCDQMSLPPIGERRRRINERLAWMEERTQGRARQRHESHPVLAPPSRRASRRHGRSLASFNAHKAMAAPDRAWRLLAITRSCTSLAAVQPVFSTYRLRLVRSSRKERSRPPSSQLPLGPNRVRRRPK